MEKRTRGERYSKYLIKIAILVYLRDNVRSASDIHDFLKKYYGLTETKNVKIHLTKLHDSGILHKTMKYGIGSYYKWNHTLDAFKKIVNIFSDNDESTRLVYYKLFNKYSFNITQFHVETLTLPKEKLDLSRLWYYTNYGQSFLNKKTVSSSIHHAYKKYLSKKPAKKLLFKHFKTIVLERRSESELVTMMYYSPRLVKYILNLDKHYEHKLDNLKIIENKINTMLLIDWLENKPIFGVKESFNDGIYIKKGNEQGSLEMDFHSKLFHPKNRLIDHSMELKYEKIRKHKKPSILYINNKKILR